MKEIAGSKGRVFLYSNFSDLAGHFDKILEVVCGKLALRSSPFLIQKINSLLVLTVNLSMCTGERVFFVYG